MPRFQPAHAKTIAQPGKHAVRNPVFAFPAVALAVVHGDFRDGRAGHHRQGGDEAVVAVEEGHVRDESAFHHAGGAADVGDRFPSDQVARAVADLR